MYFIMKHMVLYFFGCTAAGFMVDYETLKPSGGEAEGQWQMGRMSETDGRKGGER